MAVSHHFKFDYKFKNALPSGDHINNGVSSKKNFTRTSMESKIAIKKDHNDDCLHLEKSKKFDDDNESAYEESFCSDVSDEAEIKSTDIKYYQVSELSDNQNPSFQYTSSKIDQNKDDSLYLKKKLNTTLKIDDSSFVLEDRMKSLSLNEIRSTRSFQQTHTIRKNMSFTNNEMMRIERDNEFLLKRIMAQQKPQKTKLPPTQRKVSSSEINRRKLQKRIDEDNMVHFL